MAVTRGRMVLLAPHHDDETLFAAFLALKHQPDLVVCTHGDVQGQRGSYITHHQRVHETDCAWAILNPGSDWQQWDFTDNPARTAWRGLEARIVALAAAYDHCIAPAWETGGHEHHNAVALAAAGAFGEARVTRYLTYTRSGGRSTYGTPVLVEDAQWVVRKLKALACHESQITEPSTRPWFLGALTEYVA